MKVSIVYALPQRQLWLDVEVPDGASVQDAIAASGILEQCPEIDLEQQKVGIFNKLAQLDAALTDGDRVEIYRPVTADPQAVARRAKPARAAAAAKDS